MKLLTLPLVALTFLFNTSIAQQQKGYTDLDKLYRDFPVILKSDKWADIENYCSKILPDEGTLKYMAEKNFSYRGLPEAKEKMPLVLDYARVSYMAMVARFRASLENADQLKDLTFVKVEQEGTEMVNKDLGIEATETFIILKSGDSREMRCKLGEMFKINGYWKSFTEPKLGW